MKDTAWLARQTESSLRRLLPRLESRFKGETDAMEWQAYLERLRTHFPRLFRALHTLYGQHYDFFYHLESMLASATDTTTTTACSCWRISANGTKRWTPAACAGWV